MSNDLSMRQKPRVLFFGMPGQFSLPILTALYERGIVVCAIVTPTVPLPGTRPLAIQLREPPHTRHIALPLIDASPSIIQFAWTHQIPCWEVRDLHTPEVLTTLATYQPDLICVACFSLLLPRTLLNLPRLGCLNVHPSLLPANRGPVPLFWTFREGCPLTGVTVHLIDEKMDSGDILEQETIALPDGITYAQLEAQCAIKGGELLTHAIQKLWQGNAIRRPQDEKESSYHPFPGEQDFVVQAEEWDARHLYNFVRGIGRWGGPVEIHAGGEVFLVYDSTSYSLYNRSEPEARGMTIFCKTGTIQVDL